MYSLLFGADLVDICDEELQVILSTNEYYKDETVKNRNKNDAAWWPVWPIVKIKSGPNFLKVAKKVATVVVIK